jgi:tetratricopeptide (TPR) repeat protein
VLPRNRGAPGGDFPAAAQALEQALGMLRELGDRHGATEVLNELGTLHRLSGQLAAARESHREALAAARDTDNPWNEAHALAGLGRRAVAAGDAAQAETLLRQALDIFQRIGAAEAAEVAAELAALPAAAD